MRRASITFSEYEFGSRIEVTVYSVDRGLGQATLIDKKVWSLQHPIGLGDREWLTDLLTAVHERT